MKLSFYGAAGIVTGSKHLITTDDGQKILLDCGMFQGRGSDTDKMNKHFGFQAHEIDHVILSHAHIDHSGLLPKLVKDGYPGKIHCTIATRDLCEILLQDSAFIQEADVKYINKVLEKEGKDPIQPLYNIEDAFAAMHHFRCMRYNSPKLIHDDIQLMFTDAGHILGSAVTNLMIKEKSRRIKLAYTGDVGRYINRVIKRPQVFPQADYIIIESTYGNRVHDPVDTAVDKLDKTIQETIVERRGKLIIPAFSVSKTQGLIYTLNKLKQKGKLPNVPIYVDSPLAINATQIMKEHTDCYSDSMLKFMKDNPDPFGFNNLHYVRSVEKSKELNTKEDPCIIISASGMATGGRVMHHIANNIENPNNAVLFIGYCEPSTLGGRLIAGDKTINVYGNHYSVKARVNSIDFFSSHADRNELSQFLNCQDPLQVKKVFVVHGNDDARIAMKEMLIEKGFLDVVIPDHGESFQLG